MSIGNNNGESGLRVRLGVSARELVLLAVGFGCMVGYSRMLSLGFVGYISQGVYESADPWYALRSGLTLAALLALSLAGWMRRSVIDARVLMAATAAAVAAAIVFAVDSTSVYGWAVAILGGVGDAVLMYVWMLVLSRYSVHTIAAATAAGLVLSGLIIMGGVHIDQAISLVIAVVSAFAAGACALLIDVGLESCVADGPLDLRFAVRVPWMSVVMLLACSFLITLLYAIAEHLTWLYNWEPSNVAFGAGVVVMVVSTYAIMLRSRNWMRIVWIPLACIVFLALLLSCFSIRSSIQVAVGLMLASVFSAHFLHWVIFPALFRQTRVPRAFLTGVILICANSSAASALGDMLGSALPHSMQNLGGVAGIVTIALVAVSAVAYLANRSVLKAYGRHMIRPALGAAGHDSLEKSNASVIAAETAGAVEAAYAVSGSSANIIASQDAQSGSVAPSQEGASELSPLDILQARIDDIAANHGLTPRETEIAFHTAQGFSCGYIANKLVVSESTVRFHQKNLYRKLEIHSRNEFIEFVNVGT